MSRTERFATFRGNPKVLHPLSLAFIGDGVYELLVRSYLIENTALTTRTLHRQSITMVSAPAQAAVHDAIADHLSEAEADILRRGRNAKVSRVPKNATTAEYHKSTALEALFGYLYLAGELARMEALFSLAVDTVENKGA